MVASVRLGDWRDVLAGTYDPARTVVITDPPFGLGVRDEQRHAAEQIDRGYDDVVPWRDHVAAVLADLPAARHVIRGPAQSVIQRDYPQPRRLCIEAAGHRRRTAQRPGVVPHLWHAWCVYGRLLITRRARPPNGDAMLIQPYVDDGLRGSIAAGQHRGLTPYQAALWMVEIWCEPGWLVLDPFAGTGTIGRAAQAHGHDYLGAELVPRWYERAADMHH